MVMDGNCVSALDCSNNTLIKDCYQENKFLDEINFCECQNWVGWTGPLCDQPGPTVFYSRIALSIILIWHFFNFITAIKSTFIYLKYNRNNQSLLKSNPIFFVALLTVVASFAFLLNNSIDVPSLYDHTFFEVNIQNSLLFGEIIEVQAKYRNIRLFIVPFGVVSHFISCLIIILSWLDVFDSIDKVFYIEKIFSATLIKRVIFITTALSFIFGTVFASLNLISELVIMYFIATLLLTIWYTVGYKRFKKLYILFMDNDLDERERDSLNLVKTSWLVNATCFSIFVLSSLVLAASFNIHKEIIKIGGFNYLMLAITIQAVSGITSVSFTSYYVYRINKNLLHKTMATKSLSWIF